MLHYRAAERIEGAQDKYRKWGPAIWIVRRGSGGHTPRKI